MSSAGTVVVRRTWPQRLVILCTLAVIAAAVGVSWFLDDVYASVTRLGRVEFAADVLVTDTEPGDPVNFLLIGEDSAAGIDPSDPVTFGREVDSRGRFHADSISILRVNPTTGQAWVLSVPRDLLVDHDGVERPINAVLLVGGHDALVKTIKDNFRITINHYMSLDFLGFREVVDELDGIPIWFDNPARDANSGLDIPTAGCHVLDGVEALQYVRARHYEELVDGDWTKVGNSDFGRVERQQDFLVLAMDRAIARGARNPSNLASLIGAGAESIVLDDRLTVAELVDVGEAFSDFNPDNLQRFELQVETRYDAANRYLGERPIEGVNEPVFAVFRGEADLRSAADVSFDLYGPDPAETERIALELEGERFTVNGRYSLPPVEGDNVVIHPPGQRAAAETIARYLLPIPRLVEDPTATSLSLVLGTDHEQVLIFLPHAVPMMQAAVAELGDGPVPSLAGAVRLDDGGETPTTTSTTTVGPVDDPGADTTTTSAVVATDTTVPTTTGGIIGRAPEGESCG